MDTIATKPKVSHSCCSPSDKDGSNNDCGCDTDSERSETPCPICGQKGMTVREITPRSTLKAQYRPLVRDDTRYHFCETTECLVVYYHGADQGNVPGSIFTMDQLINRVTVKDDDPTTPLCYCFKVCKGEALAEIGEKGTVDIKGLMNRRRKPGQSCFCEKSNPRGHCCTGDIKGWLADQGVIVESDEDICDC
jgi:hypothetical protein